MRNMGVFLDELHFPFGLNADNTFSPEEISTLESFGLTMRQLQEGNLLPLTAAEYYFLAELDGEFPITSHFARCWRKYNTKVTRFDNNATSRAKTKRPTTMRDDSGLNINTEEDDDEYGSLTFDL
ncbi:DUF413 domain-containing protein [Moritella sp. Urea-trap-13]|uniref:DUF413 domain-containing protein n=1 Tax=Moritella sp. Urea-trap-13 TaxID=2058327 RepID=UPI000C31F6F4|nr:DUF413 domain-containing protein [Moritella sp. Urea-trap-13]PKH07009.1 hypothetical protein CXF93_14120 [Moritella sp. Urea-trap-13]